VIPSFGGFSADQGGTEIADSCKNVSQIAADYESVITTLGVTRLDMDVEAKSLNNTAGIDRRNKAISMTEGWRKSRDPLQIQYTIPVDSTGWTLTARPCCRMRSPTAPPVVNIDYYIAGEGVVNMGQAASTRPPTLTPSWPPSTRADWNNLGMTLLPGIDDYPKKTEVTSLAARRRCSGSRSSRT